jgi:hypothetical protein
MISKLLRALALTVAAMAAVGCMGLPVGQTYTERIILLPSRDGHASGLFVQRTASEHALSKSYETLELLAGHERKFDHDQKEVERRYGALLKAQSPTRFAGRGASEPLAPTREGNRRIEVELR